MPDPRFEDASALASPIAIFTDFDGTLVDLAPTPDAISVPETLADELIQAASDLDGAIAVISGRAIADLDKYIPPKSVALAGSHGAERRRTDGSEVAIAVDRSVEAIERAARLQELVGGHPGLLLETKPGAVALHYRGAPELEALCRAAMEEAFADALGFSLLRGKMVIEARPSDLGKGEAIKAFAAEPPFRGRVPIFLGDDATDEDGFVAAQALGGVGIKVGPGETAARMRTPDAANARALIRELAALARRQG